MQTKIKTHSLGKLRIYLPTGEKIKSAKFVRKLFPRSTYRQIITEAKKDGLLSASVFSTHLGYNNKGKIQQQSFETGNDDLTICVELIDTREKLEAFFDTHKTMLKGKVIIYKEVEFWDME